MISAVIWLVYISEMFSNVDQTLSTYLKSVTLIFLLMMVFWKIYHHKKAPKFLYLYFIFIIFSIYPIYISFNLMAAMTEFIRYLTPLIAITVGYLYKDEISRIVNTLFVITITNNLYMIYAYIAFTLGFPTILEPWYESGIFIRAYGWLGVVTIFGAINFACFLLCYTSVGIKFYRYKYFFLTFSLLSLSFKLFPYFIISLVLLNFKKINFYPIFFLVIIFLLYNHMDIVNEIYELAIIKIEFYVSVGNSARFESYRVMYESLTSGNFFGEGIGSFGGPSSTNYNSPLYQSYYFNWYGMQEQLNTTDTFYPHVFVELGLFTGIIYLSCFFIPYFLMERKCYDKKNRIVEAMLLIMIFGDAFWAFSMTSVAYILPTYFIIFGLKSFEISNDKGV